jgi:hypothetical protein
MKDLNGLLAGEIPRAKAEIAKHCTDITSNQEGNTYRLSGEWHLLGVLRSDDAGGPIESVRAYAFTLPVAA